LIGFDREVTFTYQADISRKAIRKTLEKVQWHTEAEATRANRHGKKVTKAPLVVASNRKKGKGHLKRGLVAAVT